ncbi:glycosyltransferase family 2 protein [Sphaerisporangium fuscum]|uniref:glycosyltransferase family 2 protein n=1 Tax=Sphaerisporangium fuscum TaxID=2835868 RepID=UPI001BDDA5D4|nr:glycosyltransferase family A protein [Sphaerisporangium fuscum]
MNGSIEAVIVNHNTSTFAEIALRSLRWTIDHAGLAETVRITVVDNHSTDDTSDLKAALNDCGARWELSRWPASKQALTTHGDVLRDFVLSRPEAAGYFFVESDMCLLERDILAVMLAEVTEEPDVWAVQARQLIPGAPRDAAPFTSAVHRRRRRLELTAQLAVETDDGTIDTMNLVHKGHKMPRCHPGCALLANSTALQLGARHLGFSAAWTWSNDPALGGLNDTLGLVSNVLRTHGKRSRLSTASVIHFWHGSRIGVTDHHRRLIALLRAGDMEEFAAEATAGLATSTT